MDYLITSIEYVAKYGDRIAAFYEINHASGQFFLPQYKAPDKHWALTCAM
jgi:hypothetical protein